MVNCILSVHPVPSHDNYTLLIPVHACRKPTSPYHLRFGALGGGGKRGTPPPVDPLELEEDPRMVLVLFLDPRLRLIENVCPSFRE
jgi:hypothetical protein